MSNLIDKPSILIDKCSKANPSYKIRLIKQVNSSLKLASFNRSEAKSKPFKWEPFRWTLHVSLLLASGGGMDFLV